MSSNEIKTEMYESEWKRYEDFADICVEAGLTIPHAIQIASHQNNTKFFPEEETIRYMKQLNMPFCQDGYPLFRVAVQNGEYRHIPRSHSDQPVISDILIDVMPPDTDYVVELGAGWGHNLFFTYCQMPVRKFKERLKYIACEYTASGRAAFDKIASLDPDGRLSSHFFDYYNPDLSFLKKKPNVVFLTRHSIEQIQTLPDSFFEEVLDKTGACTCVHFEPVGWQRNLDLRALVESGDIVHQVKNLDFSPDRSDLVLPNAARWSHAHEYNRNFLELVDRYQKSGAIRINRLHYELMGMNPFNPSTCIVWEKA